jgi:hypothetical protein
MKRNQLYLTTLLSLILLTCLVEGQMMSGYGMGQGMMGGGYGMGGMMGSMMGLITVPDRLPTPNNDEWVQNLRDVLSLEKRSYVQYTADEQKYNVGMPYMMVVPQEMNHISSIEKMFSAYGIESDGNPEYAKETTSLTDAYQLATQMEQDLISRYSWLVQNAADRDSAQILNDIAIQSNWHLQMFQMALNMGGYGMMGGY